MGWFGCMVRTLTKKSDGFLSPLPTLCSAISRPKVPAFFLSLSHALYAVAHARSFRPFQWPSSKQHDQNALPYMVGATTSFPRLLAGYTAQRRCLPWRQRSHPPPS
jgi:hypothetical protein